MYYIEILTDHHLLLHPGGGDGRRPAADLAAAVQHLDVAGREPPHLPFPALGLQLALPPARVSLLADHDELAASQRQLLRAGGLVGRYHGRYLRLLALHHLVNGGKFVGMAFLHVSDGSSLKETLEVWGFSMGFE